MPEPARPGDLHLEVDVTDRRHGSICVIDRGKGMPDEVRSRVFQPFVSSDRGTGHGLGLAFCQRVVFDARGTAFAVFGGGSLAQLEAAAQAAQSTGVWAQAPTARTSCSS